MLLTFLTENESQSVNAFFSKYKKIALLICLIIVAICGVQMYRLPLWEWWTFPFMVAVWVSLILLFEKGEELFGTIEEFNYWLKKPFWNSLLSLSSHHPAFLNLKLRFLICQEFR